MEPSQLVVEELEWSVNGYDVVLLTWDHTTDDEIARLSGAGFKDYSTYGGKHSVATGNTGDILIATTGGAAGDNFDITIVARLKE